MNIGMLYVEGAEAYGTGTIRLHDSTQPIPEGWLWCDGESHRTADYLELAQIVGFSYGGPAPETFAVPTLLNVSVAGIPAVLNGIIKT